MDVRKTYIEARGTGTQKKNRKREKQNTYLPSTGEKKYIHQVKLALKDNHFSLHLYFHSSSYTTTSLVLIM